MEVALGRGGTCCGEGWEEGGGRAERRKNVLVPFSLQSYAAWAPSVCRPSAAY